MFNSGAMMEAECAKPMQVIPPTMTEKIEEKQRQLEKELAEVTAALNLLKEHPETQKVLDALTKLRLPY